MNKMQGNNTTIIEDCLDCVSESSSLLDDIEVILVAGLALVGIAVWAYKKYQTLNADGKITLDEIIDSMDEVKEKAEEANKLAFAKLLMMEEPLVTAARLDGYIELIDEEGLPTADNLRPTQKFKDSGKSLLDIFQKKNVQRTTDTEGSIRRYGKAPAFGITYLSGVDIPEATKDIVAICPNACSLLFHLFLCSVR